MAVDEPSFFKLIFDLQKLAIPMKFDEKYGEELSDGIITLNIRTGAVWEVKLVREKGRAWLQKGWSEFVEFYSINYGYFLLFTYKGNSAFDVLIFNMTGCEIKYPVASINACGASPKRKREADNSSALTIPSNKVLDKVFTSRCLLTPDEKRRAEEYQCEYPSFVVKLSPSHVSYKAYVNIPIEFARKYLKNELGEFKLHNATGKTWLVMCVSYASHVSLTIGWRQFANDNELRLGDICVFELTKSAKTFRVVVLPAPGETPLKLAISSSTKQIRDHKTLYF